MGGDACPYPAKSSAWWSSQVFPSLQGVAFFSDLMWTSLCPWWSKGPGGQKTLSIVLSKGHWQMKRSWGRTGLLPKWGHCPLLFQGTTWAPWAHGGGQCHTDNTGEWKVHLQSRLFGWLRKIYFILHLFLRNMKQSKFYKVIRIQIIITKTHVRCPTE